MISSKTLDKRRILRGFSNHDFCILLSTTILERGVTFKGCDAYVLESDHRVFDRDTLIQIAGRVGRDRILSDGHVVFFSRHLTKAMQEAKQSLIEMNHAM